MHFYLAWGRAPNWKETMLTGIGSTGNDTTAVERDFVKVLDHMIQHSI